MWYKTTLSNTESKKKVGSLIWSTTMLFCRLTCMFLEVNSQRCVYLYRKGLLSTNFRDILTIASQTHSHWSNRKRIPCLHKHSRGWANSPNPSSVHIRLCKHRENNFYCFCQIIFPRKKQNSSLWHGLKEKFLPVSLVHELLYAY